MPDPTPSGRATAVSFSRRFSVLLHSGRQRRAGLLGDHVAGVPVLLFVVPVAEALLVHTVRGLGAAQRAYELGERSEGRGPRVHPSGQSGGGPPPQPTVAVPRSERR